MSAIWRSCFQKHRFILGYVLFWRWQVSWKLMLIQSPKIWSTNPPPSPHTKKIWHWHIGIIWKFMPRHWDCFILDSLRILTHSKFVKICQLSREVGSTKAKIIKLCILFLMKSITTKKVLSKSFPTKTKVSIYSNAVHGN